MPLKGCLCNNIRSIGPCQLRCHSACFFLLDPSSNVHSVRVRRVNPRTPAVIYVYWAIESCSEAIYPRKTRRGVYDLQQLLASKFASVCVLETYSLRTDHGAAYEQRDGWWHDGSCYQFQMVGMVCLGQDDDESDACRWADGRRGS